jgi:hypothetical protein
MASQPRKPSLNSERLTGMSKRLIIEQQALGPMCADAEKTENNY